MSTEQLFQSAKFDINIAYTTRTPDQKLTGDWIYSVDPETMDFIKTLRAYSSGDNSTMGIFMMVLKSKNIDELINALLMHLKA